MTKHCKSCRSSSCECILKHLMNVVLMMQVHELGRELSATSPMRQLRGLHYVSPYSHPDRHLAGIQEVRCSLDGWPLIAHTLPSPAANWSRHHAITAA